MRVAHFGTFDVANYGDALFPLVLERRLPNFEVTHVSPLGGSSKYSDGVVSISCETADTERFDAIVIGGGNIINRGRGGISDYQSIDRIAYPSLWLGAAALAQRQRIPLVINGPSVSTIHPPIDMRWMLRSVAARANYVAVRDEVSREAIGIGSGFGVKVVPDTALDVNRLWSKEDLSSSMRRLGLDGVRTVAIHMKDKYIASDQATANAVDDIAVRLEARPLLVAIGQCHGDDRVHSRIAALMRTDPICLVPESLVDVAAIVNHSTVYAGSSMHGFITAAAFDTPGVLVLNRNPHHKFTGILKQLDFRLAEAISSDWDVVARAEFQRVDAETRSRVLSDLDSHWASVEKALAFNEHKQDSTLVKHWRPAINAWSVASDAKRAVRRQRQRIIH